MNKNKRKIKKLVLSDSFKKKLEGTLVHKGNIPKPPPMKKEMIKKNNKTLIIKDNTTSIPCTKKIIESVRSNIRENYDEKRLVKIKDDEQLRSIIINNVINYPIKRNSRRRKSYLNNTFNDLCILGFFFSIGVFVGRVLRRK